MIIHVCKTNTGDTLCGMSDDDITERDEYSISLIYPEEDSPELCWSFPDGPSCDACCLLTLTIDADQYTCSCCRRQRDGC